MWYLTILPAFIYCFLNIGSFSLIFEAKSHLEYETEIALSVSIMENVLGYDGVSFDSKTFDVLLLLSPLDYWCSLKCDYIHVI